MVGEFELSVPANVLVAGEYAITAAGGLGIALAVEPRAYARVERSDDSLYVVGIGARSAETHWPDQSAPLIDAVVRTFREITPFEPAELAATIWVDTSQLYHAGTGGKLGLGSSAAATVLIVAALYTLASGSPPRLDELIDTAVKAHRAANHGRGSGYDVITSACGGTVLFCGGATPTWQPVDDLLQLDDEHLQLHRWKLRRSVASSRAVERFETYFPAHSQMYTDVLTENEAVIRSMLAARTWRRYFQTVGAARALGERIGAEIGVPASLPVGACHHCDGWIAKASGAGNELALVFSLPHSKRPIPSGSVPLSVARHGLSIDGHPLAPPVTDSRADRNATPRHATL